MSNLDIEALRTKAISDSAGVAEKSRFGLFGYPLSNAIGDDGEYKTKLHPRNQNGKPQTSPRGVFTNPTRTGQLRKSFFSGINSLAELKDQYIDPDRKLLQIQNQNFKKGFTKQQNFRPASFMKTLHKPAYQYTQQKNPQLDPKRNRQQDGRVKTKPRNAFTNIQSTVIRSYFKPLAHLPDPYERAHQLQIQKMKRDKQLEAQAPFKPNNFHAKVFNKDKLIYGQDVQLKAKTAREPNFNIYKHQTKWKDTNQSKSGYNRFFTPVTYKQDPPKQKTRINLQSDKQPFKTKSVPKSIVSPSITLTCLKRQFNRTFSLRR